MGTYSIVAAVMLVAVVLLIGAEIMDALNKKACPVCNHNNIPDEDGNFICENCNKNY